MINLEKYRRRAESIEEPPMSFGMSSGQSLEKEAHYETSQYLSSALDEIAQLRSIVEEHVDGDLDELLDD